MLRKLTLAALLALAFLATAYSSKIINPVPECEPCPWVR